MHLGIEPAKRVNASLQAHIGGFRRAGNAYGISRIIRIFLRHPGGVDPQIKFGSSGWCFDFDIDFAIGQGRNRSNRDGDGQ